MHYEKIKKDPERISKIKPFIDQYNWKDIDFSKSHSKDWKKIESNNKSIALNILYVPHNTIENHDYCYVQMPEKDNKILKYNQGEKYMKVPFIIYADLESLLEKMNICHNNPEKLSTTKINKHTPSG